MKYKKKYLKYKQTHVQLTKDKQYYRKKFDKIIINNKKNIDKLFSRLKPIHEFEVYKLLETLYSLNLIEKQFRYGIFWHTSNDIQDFINILLVLFGQK